MPDRATRGKPEKPLRFLPTAVWAVIATIILALVVTPSSQAYTTPLALEPALDETVASGPSPVAPEISVEGIQIPPLSIGIQCSAWWPEATGLPTTEAVLEQFSMAGATWVGLTVPAYQMPGNPTALFTGWATPSDEELVRTIQAAHGLGLKVMLKVEAEPFQEPAQDPAATGSETTLHPHFRGFVEHYADIAETHGVDLLGLGASLVELARQSPAAHPLAVLVRSRYSGPITYSADRGLPLHNSALAGPDWWGAVGYSGITARYYPPGEEPSPDEYLADRGDVEEDLAAQLSTALERPVLFTEVDQARARETQGSLWDWLLEQDPRPWNETRSRRQALGRISTQPWFGGMFWGREGATQAQPTDSLAQGLSETAIRSLNNRFLMLNMHGALFHSEPRDLQENIAYAQWMGAGVMRVFATDSNSFKNWDGRLVANRIADAAPIFRAANVKVLVSLVNNHQPVPGEAVESSGWMDDYYQLLLPFYTSNWRDAYLRFAREFISTIKERGALDVIFAWELGNELHTPQDPAAIIPFITDAVEEIRKLDPTTPILPGTMGANHLQPWRARSPIARWLYCDAPVDAYTLHAYDWVSQERQGDMPISWDLDNITVEPCRNGRKLPVIVEELGTSKELPWVYTAEQEQKRLEQELRQIRYVLSYPQVIGIGAWNGQSPRVVDRTFHDNRRGLSSYGPGGTGGGSSYDPRPLAAPGARGQLEQILRNLPGLP